MSPKGRHLPPRLSVFLHMKTKAKYIQIAFIGYGLPWHLNEARRAGYRTLPLSRGWAVMKAI